MIEVNFQKTLCAWSSGIMYIIYVHHVSFEKEYSNVFKGFYFCFLLIFYSCWLIPKYVLSKCVSRDAALLTALLFCSCCICADAEHHRAEKQKEAKCTKDIWIKKQQLYFEIEQPQELFHCVWVEYAISRANDSDKQNSFSEVWKLHCLIFFTIILCSWCLCFFFFFFFFWKSDILSSMHIYSWIL